MNFCIAKRDRLSDKFRVCVFEARFEEAVGVLENARYEPRLVAVAPDDVRALYDAAIAGHRLSAAIRILTLRNDPKTAPLATALPEDADIRSWNAWFSDDPYAYHCTMLLDPRLGQMALSNGFFDSIGFIKDGEERVAANDETWLRGIGFNRRTVLKSCVKEHLKFLLTAPEFNPNIHESHWPLIERALLDFEARDVYLGAKTPQPR